MTLHVTDKFLYPIVVTVSVITTFFTPYMIRLADPAYQFVTKHLPTPWFISLTGIARERTRSTIKAHGTNY